jgi:hypothetical protein
MDVQKQKRIDSFPSWQAETDYKKLFVKYQKQNFKMLINILFTMALLKDVVHSVISCFKN